MYKVAIVEDDKKLLKLLSILIESTNEFELAGTYYNGNLFLNDFKSLDLEKLNHLFLLMLVLA